MNNQIILLKIKVQEKLKRAKEVKHQNDMVEGAMLAYEWVLEEIERIPKGDK